MEQKKIIFPAIPGIIKTISFISFSTLLLLFIFPSLDAQDFPEYKRKKLIYENPLSDKGDLEGVIIESSEEGQPVISFNEGKMKLQSDVHFLLWFPEDFPGDIMVSWNFLPEVDDGLAMFWFSTTGKEGEDIFDGSLAERTGSYSQYHSGDINAYHLSYFRRNEWDDPYLNTVNLRKSYGKKIVASGPNPIPNIGVEKVAKSITEPYRIKVIKLGGNIRVEINDLHVLTWKDDHPYDGGKIGFRQMANLIAEYSNLKVYELEKL